MIDRAVVTRLAHAAHIHLAHEEIDRIAAQLNSILGEMASVVALGRTNNGKGEGEGEGEGELALAASAEPLVAPPGAPTPLRADEPSADPLIGTLSRFAPEVKEGFFVVPRLASHRGEAP